MSKDRERKECEKNAKEGILLLETKNVLEIGFKRFEYKKVKFNLNASVKVKVSTLPKYSILFVFE